MNIVAAVVLIVVWILVSTLGTLWIASSFHVEDMSPEEEEMFWQAWISYDYNYVGFY